MKKKVNRIAALLASAALLFGALSCSSDSGGGGGSDTGDNPGSSTPVAIVLTADPVAEVTVGETITVKSNIEGVKFSSSDSTVATVEESTGVVKGVKAGNVTIIAKKDAANGKTYTSGKVEITVKEAAGSGDETTYQYTADGNLAKVAEYENVKGYKTVTYTITANFSGVESGSVWWFTFANGEWGNNEAKADWTNDIIKGTSAEYTTTLTVANYTNGIYLAGTSGAKYNIELTSYTEADGGDEKTLSSIAVKTNPDKTAYTVGDTALDLTGLVITLTYSDSTKEDVTYSSKNASSFTTSGFHSSAAADSLAITVTYNGKSATFNVTVNGIPVTSVTVSGDTTVKQGLTITLTAVVAPENATNNTVTWKSSNEEVATVDGGVVKGVKAGTAKITATADGVTSNEYEVTVEANNAKLTSITKKSDPEKLKYNVGDKINLAGLEFTLTYDDGENGNVAYSSSDDALFTVSGFNSGKAATGQVVTVTYISDGITGTATFTVTIVQPVTKVTVSGNSTVEVAGKITLTAAVEPTDATDSSVTWSSSDPSVATVADGVVTGVAEGTAVITATANDGSKAEDSHTVTVTKQTGSLEIVVE